MKESSESANKATGHRSLRSRLWNGTAPTLSEQLHCKWTSPHSDTSLEWAAPVFTRMPVDQTQAFAAIPSLFTSIAKHHIPWLGNADAAEAGKGPILSRIAPIDIDQAIDLIDVNGADASEFQLYGLPFTTTPRSRLAAWTPSLPIDLEHHDELAQRIGLLRVLHAGHGLIGAALPATPSVRKDVRFLIESGFDYVTLLTDAPFGTRPEDMLNLGDPADALEQAIRARTETNHSPASFPIFLSTAARSAEEVSHWLTSGASAVCIDAYLIAKRPQSKQTNSESFGSFLSGYTPPTPNTPSWVDMALNELLQSIADHIRFRGYSGMAELQANSAGN